LEGEGRGRYRGPKKVNSKTVDKWMARVPGHEDTRVVWEDGDKTQPRSDPRQKSHEPRGGGHDSNPKQRGHSLLSDIGYYVFRREMFRV